MCDIDAGIAAQHFNGNGGSYDAFVGVITGVLERNQCGYGDRGGVLMGMGVDVAIGGVASADTNDNRRGGKDGGC